MPSLCRSSIGSGLCHGVSANDKARSMVFFYHDPHNDRLRMHTIRDYLP